MAISKLLGLEHLPQGEGFGTIDTCFGMAGLNLTPALAISGGASGGRPLMSINGNKIELGRKANATSITIGGGYTLRLTALWGPEVIANAANIKRLVLGFRFESLASGLGSIISFAFCNNTAAPNSTIGDLGVGIDNVGNIPKVLNSGALGAQVPNAFYGEFVFRTPSGGGNVIVEFYVDGTLVATINPTVTLAALIADTGRGFIFGRSGATGFSSGTVRQIFYRLSDIYSLYDDGTAGDAYVDRLGPTVVRKLPVIAVDVSNWTPSDGVSAAKDVLNLRRDNSTGTDNTTTPTLTSNSDASALVARIDPSPLIQDPVAVQLASSAVRPSGVTGNLDISGIYNGATLVDKVFTDIQANTTFLDRTVQPISKLGTDSLTKANLANLKISLKPT